MGWEWLSTGLPFLKWFQYTLVFLFTLNPFRLSSLIQVVKSIGSLQEQKRNPEETDVVFHHIFLEKTATIITPKHGTAIFLPITILF